MEAEFQRLFGSEEDRVRSLDFEAAKYRYVEERLDWELEWGAICRWFGVLLVISVVGFPFTYFLERARRSAVLKTNERVRSFLKDAAESWQAEVKAEYNDLPPGTFPICPKCGKKLHHPNGIDQPPVHTSTNRAECDK